MSFFGWVDYDDAYEKLARDAVTALKGRDARDELGLGGVRDTLSDLFFPGTSTIQRRLRYFLFVPWCCEAAIQDGRGRPLLSVLRVKEEGLIGSLGHLGARAGVIGLRKGAGLVTMPSAIYWSGLRALDILKVRGSTGRWAHFVYERRRGSIEEPPSEDGHAPPRLPGFEYDLPPMPERFPATEGLNFKLTSDETRYLRRRLSTATVGRNGWGLQHNLFAAFVGAKVPPRIRYPWDHPRVASLDATTKDFLEIARVFSSVMYGATLLHNYLLCSRKHSRGDQEALSWMDYHLVQIRRWSVGVKQADLEVLRHGINEVAQIAPRLRHSVTPKTVKFVNDWLDVSLDPHGIERRKTARQLVENRERALKSQLGTSRFANTAALERWNYASGGRLNYRWTIAQSYINDLAAA